MTPIPMSDLSPELLAQHDGWLRALVRRLVDDGQADDVVQEVWGHAMNAELRDQKALPAWLARVARRIAGKSVRSKHRRRNHEQVAAQTTADSVVDPAELVARVEGRQQVAQTVLELAEPFRTVVLLRYFEDQTPEQIAQQLHIPGATVRTRLHRAHEQLRQRFERERGSEWRGQLAALVVPMGALDGTVQPPATVATAQPKALLVLVPLAVATLAWVLVQTMSSTPPPAVAPGGTTGVATANLATGSAGTAVNLSERDSATIGDDAATAPQAPQTVRIAGQVVDYAGHPLSGLEVVFVESFATLKGANLDDCPAIGRSDRDGHFDVQVPRERGTLHVSNKFATLRSWQVTGGEEATGIDDALIVATKFVQLSGVVVDADGNPAPDRFVRVHIDDTVGLPLIASGTNLEFFDIKTKTDAVGNFQLRNVPAFPFGDLGVGRIPLKDALRAIPSQNRHDLRLVLGTNQRKVSRRRKTAAEISWFPIKGTVVSMSGELIEGAHARPCKSDQHVKTKADGKFELEGRVLPNGAAIVWVAAEGYAPMQLEVWPEQGEQPAVVTARLTKLTDSALALRGKVVNEHNIPVNGLMVTLADATPFEPGSWQPVYVERPGGHRLGAHAKTDSRGQFCIPGVLDRTYHLRIFDEATGFAQTHGPFHARQEWTVHIEQPRVRPELRLHVVDSIGGNVADAEVSLEVVLLHTTNDGSYASMSSTSFVGDTRKTITDESGDCRFLNAPGGDLRINVKKAGYLHKQVDHKDESNLLEVQLLRLLPFRVATHGVETRWPALKLFDEAGNELETRPAWRGNHYPSMHKFGIVRGHSVVAAFPETVHRAELRDMFSGEVLRTMTIVPNPTGITVIDFPE